MNSLLYLGVLLCCPIIGALFPDVKSDPAESLRTTLSKFAGARHQTTNPEGKTAARELIKQRFLDAGLHVWSEKLVFNGTLHGENIVGILRGARTGTAADKIVIVGAHYDTMPNTTGLDDNGSGVTALLQVAKQIGKSDLAFNNTIMLVAFDFEETTPECNITWPITCGSRGFVRNLTSYFAKTKGTINGALILETIINHNSSEGSQELPYGTDQVAPDAYNEVKNDSFRGNFLAVIGRKDGDKKLLSLMENYYEKDSEYRAQLFPIPLTGRASLSPQYDAFYRSDHYRFWDNDLPYSALLLTDTADHRGYMHKCYHKMCDDLRLVKDDDLEFLRRTINAVIQTTLELSEAEPREPTNGSSTNVLNLLLFFIAVFIAIK